MKKEFITVFEKETTLKIQSAKIDAIRTKDIVKKGVRVFEDGKIGISGAIGEVDDQVLVERATENLVTDIEYPFDLQRGPVDHRNYNQTPLTTEELLSHTENILKELRENYSEFDFSETVSIKQMGTHMYNSEGLDVKYEDATFELGLILKEKGGPNLFDGFLAYYGRTFDETKFWNQNKEILNAYRTKVELPAEEKLPVFFIGFDTLTGLLTRSLNGELYATGSSLFNGKIGEKLFNEKVNIYQWGNPKQKFSPFFDREGCILPEEKLALVKNGKLVNVFTDKKVAKMYNLPHTSAASGEYDDMPALSGTALRLDIDSEDIVKTLDGKKAILVVISSGGDFTSDGDFAAPVQVGFLFDGKKVLGKLPEFNIQSNLYKMLGDDYIGTFENPLYYGEESTMEGYYMAISK